MTDALARAFADADGMRDAARKAVGDSGAKLSAGPGGFTRRPSLSQAREQFEHGNKGWAAVAVRAIAQRIAGQDVFAARLTDRNLKAVAEHQLPGGFKSFGDRLEPLATHPILSAINRPNSLMVRWHLLTFTVANLEITGRAFWWWSNGEIWPLPASWVEPSDNLRTAWKIRPAGIVEAFEVPGTSVAHFCLPDPSNPFGSLSPLQTQAEAVATDEAIQTAQHRSFKNGAFPQLMLKAGRMPGIAPGEDGERPVLTNDQRQELIEAIRTLYRGAVNYGEPLIIDGLIEGVERLTTTPGEMEYLDSGKATKSRILEAFGVSPHIVGEIGNANRAQAAVAESTFCEFTINPLIELLSQTLTAWAQGAFLEPLALWISPCRANDPELQLDRWKAAASLGYVSGNEFRRTILNLPDRPELDTLIDPLTGEPRKHATRTRFEFSANGR